MPSEHDPPLNAVELGRAVAGAQRAADELPSDDARVRRTAALESLAAYAALLTEVVPPRPVPPESPRRPDPAHVFTLKLEYDDGRWELDELRLGTPPRVGEYIELGRRGRWQVLGSQVVVAAIRKRVEREFFRCAFVGDAVSA